MFNKYTQTDGRSCGLIALSHLFQRDFIKEKFYSESANSIPKMDRFIRQEVKEDLSVQAQFYNHEGVFDLPDYLDTMWDPETWDDVTYGIPLLIQTLGEKESLNHIFLAVLTREGVEVYDGLRTRVRMYESFLDLSKDYYKFAGVYAVGNDEHLVTWFNEQH